MLDTASAQSFDSDINEEVMDLMDRLVIKQASAIIIIIMI